MRTPLVAVIGGGIGGLAAALALHRRGIAVEVYEQSPELAEIGAGLNLSPNAMKALRALGLEREIRAVGFEAEYQLVRNWRTGRVTARQARRAVLAETFGAPYVSVHRADLLAVLGAALPESCFRLGKRCVSVGSDARAAHARFSDGSEIEADAVVGADGIHSAVRASLFGPEAPRFTGCVCWRGLVPIEAVPRGLITTDGTIWLGPHGHVVHYLLRRGEIVNIVAHYDSDAWTEESWTREADKSELRETYAQWHESLRALFECGERYYKWALYDRDPLPRWSVGRATLLGDSAHAMLPYLGQGACMAVEDACLLAAAVAAQPADIASALQVYEGKRLPRTTQTQLGSRERAKENHLPSPWSRFRRDLQFRFRQRFSRDKTVLQAGWLYAYDVAKEAEALAALPTLLPAK